MIEQREATSWDLHLINMAQFVAQKSKDPSTKVGAVVVGPGNEILTTGFNGFPRGVNEVDFPERWERPEKYDWVVHAEANCVANAARIGVSLLGATMYLNFEPSPCCHCTGMVTQAGIVRIIGPNIAFSGVGKGIHYDVDNVTQIVLDEVAVERIVINDITGFDS